jgi:molybdopterin-binding protein
MELNGEILYGEALLRRYGDRTVVDVPAVGVRRREVLAVLGPNGAGKSTLFRLLGLLEKPDAGRVLWDGEPVRTGDTAARRRLAAVFQRPFLFDGTVASNVAYGLRVRGVSRRESRQRVADALEWLGIAPLANAPVGRLSGGETQRVALARALVTRPEVLLLDEPTANLDVAVRRRFRQDLERLVRSRTAAAILITHDPSEAFWLADRVAVMEAGRIVQVGTPSDIASAPSTSFVAALAGAELLLDGEVVSTEDGLVVVRLGGGASLMAAAAGGEPERFGKGARVHVTYRPEDVVLAPEPAGRTSAVNRYRLRVTAVVPSGSLVRIRLDGDPALTALLTRRSTEELGLRPGTEVMAQIKATALHAYPAG